MPQPILNNSLDLFAQASSQTAAHGIDQILGSVQFQGFAIFMLLLFIIGWAWSKRK